tara:strand:- start:5959 stop:6141 length:183 start_codon:yes stop_codon:yes gene_type:complete
MRCAHCGKGFTCGCQKTKAPNGATVHKTCLKEYVAKNGGNKTSRGTLTKNIQKAKQNLNR